MKLKSYSDTEALQCHNDTQTEHTRRTTQNRIHSELKWGRCATAKSEVIEAWEDCVFEHGPAERWRSTTDERRTPAE